VDLAAPEWAARIIEDAKVQRYDVVVFDNLTTLSLTLEDENAAVSWNPLNNLIVALKGEGVAAVIVHHAGKGGGYRGSSALATTLETIVNLEKVSDDEACGDARFRVVVEKSRAHGVPEVHGKVLRLAGGTWVVEEDELGEVARAVRMVRSLKYGSQRELADAMGVEPMKVSRILNKGAALGLCTKDEIRERLKKAKDAREFVGDPEEYGERNPLGI
jgi:putative DNA primase/helicase